MVTIKTVDHSIILVQILASQSKFPFSSLGVRTARYSRSFAFSIYRDRIWAGKSLGESHSLLDKLMETWRMLCACYISWKREPKLSGKFHAIGWWRLHPICQWKNCLAWYTETLLHLSLMEETNWPSILNAPRSILSITTLLVQRNSSYFIEHYAVLQCCLAFWRILCAPQKSSALVWNSG